MNWGLPILRQVVASGYTSVPRYRSTVDYEHGPARRRGDGLLVLFIGSLGIALAAGLAARAVPCCSIWLLGVPLWLRDSNHGHGLWWFALGLVTAVVPLALGVGFVIHVVARLDRIVYWVEAVLLIGFGIYAWLGGRIVLPMRSRLPSHGGSAYGLGVVSGAASSCCLPLAASAMNAAPSLMAGPAVALAYAAGLFVPFWLVNATVVRVLTSRFGWMARPFQNRSQWMAAPFILSGVVSLWFGWHGGQWGPWL